MFNRKEAWISGAPVTLNHGQDWCCTWPTCAVLLWLTEFRSTVRSENVRTFTAALSLGSGVRTASHKVDGTYISAAPLSGPVPVSPYGAETFSEGPRHLPRRIPRPSPKARVGVRGAGMGARREHISIWTRGIAVARCVNEADLVYVGMNGQDALVAEGIVGEMNNTRRHGGPSMRIEWCCVAWVSPRRPERPFVDVGEGISNILCSFGEVVILPYCDVGHEKIFQVAYSCSSSNRCVTQDLG